MNFSSFGEGKRCCLSPRKILCTFRTIISRIRLSECSQSICLFQYIFMYSVNSVINFFDSQLSISLQLFETYTYYSAIFFFIKIRKLNDHNLKENHHFAKAVRFSLRKEENILGNSYLNLIISHDTFS